MSDFDFDGAVRRIHTRRFAGKLALTLIQIAGFLVGFVVIGPWLLAHIR